MHPPFIIFLKRPPNDERVPRGQLAASLALTVGSSLAQTGVMSLGVYVKRVSKKFGITALLPRDKERLGVRVISKTVQVAAFITNVTTARVSHSQRREMLRGVAHMSVRELTLQ